MLSLSQIGLEYSGNWLFQDVNFQFPEGKTTGLIGRNGTGKSSLLRIIAGKVPASEGKVLIPKASKVAFFHQDLLSFQTDQPIFELAKEAFAPVLKLKDEIDALLIKLEEGNTDPALLDDLDKKQTEFQTLDGDRIDSEVHAVLAGLGFAPEEHDKPFKQFSGGWRMRVLLAKMLLSKPEILLLDEPTNHLDLPSIQWLENYLKSYSGICILVSHDRFFMDRMAEVIVELRQRKMHIYQGNYGYYLKEKDQRETLQQRAFENQQKFLAQQEKFINRFRAKNTKAKQVQSKIKRLEKIEKVEAVSSDQAEISLRFQVRYPSGKEVLSLDRIQKSYGNLHIIKNGRASIYRGDKIALIGANGTGKSTLLRIIADNEPFEGERSPGHNMLPAFFAQHQLEALNLENTLFDELRGTATEKNDTELRTLLGCFMFTGEEVEKQISVLSGGEKSRLALAKTLLTEANFLLLDEPTNHLDIQSIQVLIQALNAYEGTFVVVSHDRYFLSEVANKIWYLEGQEIKEYPGTYEEYEYWRKKQEEARIEEGLLKTKSIPSEKQNNIPSEKNYKQQKQTRNRIKTLERKIGAVESEIEKFESEKATLLEKMATPEIAANYEALSDHQEQLDQLIEQIDRKTEEWENLEIELDELTSNP